MEIYTEGITLKITKIQKETLNKLKYKKVKISCFIREAIKEKIIRDASELIQNDKQERCPFSGLVIKKNGAD